MRRETDNLHPLALFTEMGRAIIGPYGYLVSSVLHIKEIYKNHVGLDASMADLMRPAIYGAYHHITVAGKEDLPADHVYDVIGSLCESRDLSAQWEMSDHTIGWNLEAGSWRN